MPGVGAHILFAGAKRFESTRKGALCTLLIHSDTTDGSTTFTDSVGTHTPAVGAATVAHSTDRSIWGATSIEFDGDSGYITIPDHANWYFGSTAFTIDCWIYLNTIDQINPIFGQATDANNYQAFFVDDANFLSYFQVVAGTPTVLNYGTGMALSANTWYHVAAFRGWGGNANDWAVCVDGTPMHVLTDATVCIDYAAPALIGTLTTGTGTHWFDGYIDELRVVTGTAMWTEPFTPPVGRYR